MLYCIIMIMCISQSPYDFTGTYENSNRSDDRVFAVERVSSTEMIMCGSRDGYLCLFFAERDGDQWERPINDTHWYTWGQYTNNCFYDIENLPGGYTVLTGQIGTSPRIDSWRIIVCRLDPERNISGAWSKSGGMVGYDILPESNGNVLVVGQKYKPHQGAMGMCAYHLIGQETIDGGFYYDEDWSFISNPEEWYQNERAFCALKLSNGKYVVGGENISQTNGATLYVLNANGSYYTSFHFAGEAVRDMISLPNDPFGNPRFLALISYSGNEGYSTRSSAIVEFTLYSGYLSVTGYGSVTPYPGFDFARGMKLERIADEFIVAGSFGDNYEDAGVFVSIFDQNYSQTGYYRYRVSSSPNSFDICTPAMGFDLWYNGADIGCFLATTRYFDATKEECDYFWAYHNAIGTISPHFLDIIQDDNHSIHITSNDESIIFTIDSNIESDYTALDLYDLTGRIVSTHQGQNSNNLCTFNISKVNIPNGVYFAFVRIGSDMFSRKLCIFK